MTGLEQHLKALEALKDWSNYLLVTTVAALGWASTAVRFRKRTMRVVVIGSLALSAVLGILTLALIPPVADAINGSSSSIYAVGGSFNLYWMWGPLMSVTLKWVCWPQHVLFIIGIVAYAYAAVSGGFRVSRAG